MIYLFTFFFLCLLFQSVIPIPEKLEYLRELKNKLKNVIGKERTEDHIKKVVLFCSAGTNDSALNYFTLSLRRN